MCRAGTRRSGTNERCGAVRCAARLTRLALPARRMTAAANYDRLSSLLERVHEGVAPALDVIKIEWFARGKRAGG